MDYVNCDVLVIGAGAVGLATAAKLATNGHNVIILERESRVGSVTSSRNSEVIHSGIYYDTGTMKANLCLRGKELMYQYLKERSIPHRKCGKILFCNTASQKNCLERLYKKAKNRNIKVQYCDRDQLNEINNIADAKLALEVFDTGIIDSHSYLQSLVFDIENNQGLISLDTSVISINKTTSDILTLCDQNKTFFTVRSKYVLNLSGLEALNLTKQTVPHKYEMYENYYVKGHYFSLNKKTKVNKLYYPMPTTLGLGVHLTIDLNGNIRFGPDTMPISSPYNFSQDVSSELFHESIIKNFPSISHSDITFSYAGTRPKLKCFGATYNDFKFCKDYDGRFISAFGIESPGLTASLAIAEHISKILDL